MAEKSNPFHTTVASKLVERLPASVNKFGKSFVNSFNRNKGVALDSYSFSVVSENKVLGYLNRLSADKAARQDGIPSHCVRDGASIKACLLSHDMNLSLIQGTVPGDLKQQGLYIFFRRMTELTLVTIVLCLF